MFFKDLFLIDIDQDKPADYLVRQLNIAWILGLVYFIAGFAEAPAEYFRMEEDRMIFSYTFYVIMKVTVLISFFFFMRGFILTGLIYKNYLLKIASYILIFCMVLFIGYDIVSVFNDAVEREFILAGEAMTFGGACIIFGFSLTRLSNAVGSIANFAGVFEIVAGCFYITVFLFFVGDILLIPAELFEIAILYKTGELIKSKQQ